MTGLVLKLLFKTTLALVTLGGVLGYGVHLRGGDPLALLHRVTGGAGERIVSLAGSAADGVQGGIGAAGTALPAARDDRTRVFTWQDETGITHYATEPPPDGSMAVRTVSVDPDVNVLAPEQARSRSPEQAPAQAAGLAAGLPTGVSPERAARLLEALR